MPGFSTFEREGVELTGSFTATINAEMRVGNLQETVTVTGESPIVDVSSARRQTVINNEVLKAIPTVRSYNALVVVVPGVVTNTNDVATGTATTQFPIHGGRNNEGRMTIDGLNVGNPPGGNQPPGFSVDVGNSEEISFTTSGGLGESETAGLVMNVVPKTGGNSIHGSAFYSGSGKNLQSDNTEGTGVAAPTPLTKIYDLNGAPTLGELEARGLSVHNAELTFATPDHVISSAPGRTGNTYPAGRSLYAGLREGAERHQIRLFDLGQPGQGIEIGRAHV